MSLFKNNVADVDAAENFNSCLIFLFLIYMEKHNNQVKHRSKRTLKTYRPHINNRRTSAASNNRFGRTSFAKYGRKLLSKSDENLVAH